MKYEEPNLRIMLLGRESVVTTSPDTDLENDWEGAGDDKQEGLLN